MDKLTLPLSLKAERRLAYRDGGNDVWVGRLAGQPDSEVALVAYDGQLIGNIRSAAGDFYTIRPSADGQFEMRAVTAAEASRGLESLGLDGALAPVAGAMPGALTQPLMVVASTIDVLVVYTPAAKIAAGGDNAIRARIALAIAEANAALTTSLVDASFRLVGTKELTPVSAVAEGPTPGYLADVTVDAAIIAERNATGADLVSVWINGTGASGGSAAGAGWIMSSPGAGFAPTAYSLVEVEFRPGAALHLRPRAGAKHGRDNRPGQCAGAGRIRVLLRLPEPHAVGHGVHGHHGVARGVQAVCPQELLRQPAGDDQRSRGRRGVGRSQRGRPGADLQQHPGDRRGVSRAGGAERSGAHAHHRRFREGVGRQSGAHYGGGNDAALLGDAERHRTFAAGHTPLGRKHDDGGDRHDIGCDADGDDPLHPDGDGWRRR